MTDAPTPNELLNEAGRLLGLPNLLDQNTGSLYRERFIAALILELTKRSRQTLLTLPRKK